ncbi:MAG TPA: right-handed parallel beta-helix repeat-containing protein [Actinomycetes bacterium]|nr:right-handed parallel beta-helix repeat-containing protein [Actinomycetes bacterium]
MQLDVPRPARPGPFGRRGAPGPPAVTAAVAAAVVLAAMIAASLTVLARPAGRSPAAARWAAGPRPATTEDPRAVAAGESRVHRRGRPPATTAGGGTPAPDATDPPAPAATPAGGTGAGAGALPAAPAGTAALPGALRDALASGDVLVVAPDGRRGAPGTVTRPLGSLEAARAAVRKLQPLRRDVVVLVRGGTYRRTGPLVLDARDGGARGHGVTWRAWPGERPLLSGGRPVTRWTVAGGVWTARVDVAGLRQLVVDGRRAVRARTPDAGRPELRLLDWDEQARTARLRAADAASARPGDELVVAMTWQQKNLRVSGVTPDGGGATLTFAEPDRSTLFGSWSNLRAPAQPFHLEGGRQHLDAPGEWSFDRARRTLAYRPRPGERPGVTRVVAPVAERLLDVRGTRAAPVRDLRVEGLTFQDTTWLQPDRAGYSQLQADWLDQPPGGQPYPDAAIRVEHARGLVLAGNRLRNLGGNGVALVGDVHDSRVQGNAVTDVGAGGVVVDQARHAEPADPEVTERVVVADNLVARAGQDYAGSAGILVGFGREVQVVHNDLRDLPYTGISLGWAWDSRRTAAAGNLVLSNHIVRPLGSLSDGAGIYLLGSQPGTRVEGNLVEGLARSPNTSDKPIAGVYLDNGSTGIRVAGNEVRGLSAAVQPAPVPFYLQGGIPAHDNDVAAATAAAPAAVRAAGARAGAGLPAG